MAADGLRGAEAAGLDDLRKEACEREIHKILTSIFSYKGAH